MKNLEELKWYGGCHYSSDRGRGTLTIPQQSFAEELVKKFRVTFIQSVPLRAGVWREETGKRPFRDLFGSLMRLAI